MIGPAGNADKQKESHDELHSRLLSFLAKLGSTASICTPEGTYLRVRTEIYPNATLDVKLAEVDLYFTRWGQT